MIQNRGADPVKAVSLATITDTGSYYVENVSGPEVQRARLSEMGIVAGAPVSVVTCSRDGMMVLRVGGGRMALSQGTSRHIWVQKTVG